jgi:hypothetical protein
VGASTLCATGYPLTDIQDRYRLFADTPRAEDQIPKTDLVRGTGPHHRDAAFFVYCGIVPTHSAPHLKGLAGMR